MEIIGILIILAITFVTCTVIKKLLKVAAYDGDPNGGAMSFAFVTLMIGCIAVGIIKQRCEVTLSFLDINLTQNILDIIVLSAIILSLGLIHRPYKRIKQVLHNTILYTIGCMVSIYTITHS